MEKKGVLSLINQFFTPIFGKNGLNLQPKSNKTANTIQIINDNITIKTILL